MWIWRSNGLTHILLYRMAEALEAKCKLQAKHVDHCKKFAPEAVRKRLGEAHRKEECSGKKKKHRLFCGFTWARRSPVGAQRFMASNGEGAMRVSARNDKAIRDRLCIAWKNVFTHGSLQDFHTCHLCEYIA